MVYAIIVIMTYGASTQQTNLLGEQREGHMPPTMLAWTIQTTPEKCDAVLEERLASITTRFQSAGGSVSVTQKGCSSAQDTEIYLEGLHAIPIDVKGAVRSYEVPMY
jgi:hypothetical protein